MVEESQGEVVVELDRVLAKLGREDLMPSVAERWMEEGVQRGVQQGLQQGRIEEATLARLTEGVELEDGPAQAVAAVICRPPCARGCEVKRSILHDDRS